MRAEPKPSRAGVLHAVIEEILARKDGQIPSNIEGINTVFDGTEDLTNALLLRWHTRLVASLESGLVDDPEDREEAVIEACAALLENHNWWHATQTPRRRPCKVTQPKLPPEPLRAQPRSVGASMSSTLSRIGSSD